MYRAIDARFWTDPKVRTLSPENKLLFLYLVTSPHAHYSGLYYLSLETISYETGISKKGVTYGIDTLSVGYLVHIDRVSDLIWVVNMFRYQSRSPKLVANLVKHLDELHNSPLIPRFLEHYADLEIPYEYPIDGVSIQEQEQEQYQEQNQEQEQEEEKARISSENSYITKKGRKLSGDKLAFFERFWEAFDYKEGKTQAADSWWEIKGFTAELAETIIAAAEEEAKRRPSLVTNGRTPKMAQGWISARRWEDERTLISKRGALGNERKGGVHRELFQDGGDGAED